MTDYPIEEFYESGYARFIGGDMHRPKFEEGVVYVLVNKYTALENNCLMTLKQGFAYPNGFVPATKQDYEKQLLVEALE